MTASIQGLASHEQSGGVTDEEEVEAQDAELRECQPLETSHSLTHI